ncbi:MAG: hypothetical protein U0517_04125 [Candidatus Andersenbacteria bacterium]
MKRYVVGLVVAAVTSGAALAVVLVFLNPYSAGWLGVTLLLVSVFFMAASVFTLIGFTLRVLRSRKEIVYAHLTTAFRQGLLLAVLVDGMLLLQVYRIFNIWSALLFVAAVVLIELAFASHTSSLERRERGPLHPLNPNHPNRKLNDINAKSPTPQAEPWKTRFLTKKQESPKLAEPAKLEPPTSEPKLDQPVEPVPVEIKPKVKVRRIPVRSLDGPHPPSTSKN